MKSLEREVEEKILAEILNGQLEVGTFLLPERALAEKYSVSRPVVHKAIIRLENQGLLEIRPRKGVMVLDYLINGKLSILSNIQTLKRQQIKYDLNRDMLKFILDNLKNIIMSLGLVEKTLVLDCPQDLFLLIKDYALASKNKVYPMLINEFQVGILNVSQIVFSESYIVQGFIEVHNLIYSQRKMEAVIMLEALFTDIEEKWIGVLNES